MSAFDYRGHRRGYLSLGSPSGPLASSMWELGAADSLSLACRSEPSPSTTTEPVRRFAVS
jgi:hypothetical protein